MAYLAHEGLLEAAAVGLAHGGHLRSRAGRDHQRARGPRARDERVRPGPDPGRDQAASPGDGQTVQGTARLEGGQHGLPSTDEIGFGVGLGH